VAGWLRYPTSADAELVAMVGPGGSGRLDAVASAGMADPIEDAWRTWVDEVMASWACCLLGDRALARAAVAAAGRTEHARGWQPGFRRLVTPDAHDRRAAVLLRHPDLLAPIAGLHRSGLVKRLLAGTVGAA
jgi:hypothetical protein